MASDDRQSTDLVNHVAGLEDKPYQHGFFLTLRKLDAFAPNLPPTGKARRPSQEPIRFAQKPGMDFAPSTFHSVEHRHGRPTLVGRFFGLFGPNGPLPLHLTEYTHQRKQHHRDSTFARFADVFHHRLISLLYRAWACGEPTAMFDQPESDRFSAFVGSLMGLATPAFRNRDAAADQAKLHFVGRFANATRNAEGLEAILKHFLHLPCQLEQFVGDWMRIPESGHCRLGGDTDTAVLGESATMGERVWECQHKFRLIIGPLEAEDFDRLLPGGKTLQRLVALVRNYVGDQWLWDIRLILKKEEARPASLGLVGELGYNSFLLNRQPEADSEDLTFDPMQPRRVESNRQ